jgi:glycosyltransferase involved in cell wall biosynthesis
MRVSAIITTFNRAPLAKKAIQSVLAQTYADFELIILDNSSTDGTEEMVKSFSDQRIVYVKHPQLGISAARNLGVRTARGEFVGFLDDDDEWLPKKLELQVALLDRLGADVGLVYGGFHRVDVDGKVLVTGKPKLRGDVFESYISGIDYLGGSASNPLIRKIVFALVGAYDEKLKTSEDWEFYLRLAARSKFDFVDEPLVDIRQHAGPRLGDKLEDAAYVEIVVCDEFPEFFSAHPAVHSFYLQRIGGKYCRIGKAKEGRGYLRQAIAIFPGNMTARVQYLLSFLGAGVYRWFHSFYQSFH